MRDIYSFEEAPSFEKVIKRRETKKKPLRKCITQTYCEYCQNSSLHGFMYFVGRRPLKEKLFWLCVFLISVYWSADLIVNVYKKWEETPVIVSFSERTMPVWDIPFPAVTICSETKYVRPDNNSLRYGKLFREFMLSNEKIFLPANVSEVEMENFRALLHICNTHIFEENMTPIPGKNIEYFHILDRLKTDFDRNFFYCRWLNQFNECDVYFSKTYTDEGICYTFNGLKHTDIYRENTYQYKYMRGKEKRENLTWSLEGGYRTTSFIDSYPERVLSAGTTAGLFVALQSFKHELDYDCRGPAQGFKVLLHPPDDVPMISKQFVRIPMQKEVLIAIKPSMITTSSGIASYTPERRQCYISGERRLRFFKIYTKINCELECLTNFTLGKCGCVKFSMPRTSRMKVCREEDIYCYDKAEYELLIDEFERSQEDATSVGCNCLPSCTSLVYNAEISQGNFDLEHMRANVNIESDDADESEMSRLSIYFKENQFITSKRSELYGMTDFLANCGGIFGLFTGFSILSVAELIFYTTIRLWSIVSESRKSIRF